VESTGRNTINGDSFALILDLVLLTFNVPDLGDFSLRDFDFFGVFNTIFGVFENLPPITFKSEFLCLFFAVAPFSDNAELLSKFFFFLFLHFVLWESGFLLGELSDFFELSSEFSPVVKDNFLDRLDSFDIAIEYVFGESDLGNFLGLFSGGSMFSGVIKILN